MPRDDSDAVVGVAGHTHGPWKVLARRFDRLVEGRNHPGEFDRVISGEIVLPAPGYFVSGRYER